jgi:DNA-binding response OmpR family regulator
MSRKPYDPAELAARVEALIRRSRQGVAPDQILSVEELIVGSQSAGSDPAGGTGFFTEKRI